MSRVSVAVSASVVSVVPDQGLLEGADTVFPVVIDPDLWAGQALRAMVSPSFASPQVNWAGQGGPPGSEGVAEVVKVVETSGQDFCVRACWLGLVVVMVARGWLIQASAGGGGAVGAG